MKEKQSVEKERIQDYTFLAVFKKRYYFRSGYDKFCQVTGKMDLDFFPMKKIAHEEHALRHDES